MEDDVLDGRIAGATELERRIDWSGALRDYDALLRALEAEQVRDAPWQLRYADIQFRRGNALMELRRTDAARAAIDAGLHAAKASGRPLVVAEGLMAAGVFAGSTGDFIRAERFLLEALDLYSRVPGIEARQGAGWAMLNLGSLYGKTGRLDLAFVTLEKARERLYGIENWGGVAASWEAQAQLRRAIGDEDRWREDLAEAVVFYDRERMTEKSGQLRAMLQGKLV